MEKKLLKLIKKYHTIIITRHLQPDMDAIGSQVGLAKILQENFPQKQIYMSGDSNKMDFEKLMTNPDPSLYPEALVIVTDVAVKELIADPHINLAKDVVVIDHHKNDCNLPHPSLCIIDNSAEAACMLIYEIARKLRLRIPKIAANYLLYGIITDSGRFQYIKNAARLFNVSAALTQLGADPSDLYAWLYTESKSDKLLEIAFNNKIIFDDPVAYIKTTKEDLAQLGNYDFFKISRGMVNKMAGINEIKVWCNFTYSTEKNKVIAEFRSRNIPIVKIAKKYGGGGHDFACGATLDNFSVVPQIISDFKLLINEHSLKEDNDARK